MVAIGENLERGETAESTRGGNLATKSFSIRICICARCGHSDDGGEALTSYQGEAMGKAMAGIKSPAR